MSAYLRPRRPSKTILGAAAPRDRGSSVLVGEVDRPREAMRAMRAERPSGERLASHVRRGERGWCQRRFWVEARFR